MSSTVITNYDHCLRFQVKEKRISLVDADAAEVVADNHGNICVQIKFDEQWDGVAKTARFIYNGMYKDVVLNSDDECICPSEVIKKGRFSLGVYGANLKTTTPIVISVAASILSESGAELPSDPTPGQYEQIMQLYAATTEAADEATKACWEAIEAVEAASKQLVDTKEELEQGGFITGLKETNEGNIFRVWSGTQEKYDSLEEKPKNTLCLIEDDDTLERLEEENAKKGIALLDNSTGIITDGSEIKNISDYLLVKVSIFDEVPKTSPHHDVLCTVTEVKDEDGQTYFQIAGSLTEYAFEGLRTTCIYIEVKNGAIIWLNCYDAIVPQYDSGKPFDIAGQAIKEIVGIC